MTTSPSHEDLVRQIADLQQQVKQYQRESLRAPPTILSSFLESFQYIPLCKTFEEAARKIFSQCKLLTGAKSGYVALLAENGQENEVLFLDAGGMECSVDENLPMPIRGLREIAYDTKEVAYDNAFADSPWMQFLPKGHVRLNNVLFAPLLIADQTVGLIGLANKPGGFNENDAQISSAFGKLAAVALKYSNSQQKLQRKEDLYRSILQTAMDGFWLTDKQGRLIQVNDAYCKMSGYSRDELLSMSIADLDTVDKTPERVHTRMREVIERGAVRFETRHHRKDGTVFDLEISVQFRNEDGGRCVCFLRDISERKLAEQRLREFEERFRLTFYTSPDAVNINTMDGTYLEINEGFSEMTGYTREDTIGKTSADINIWDIPEDRTRLLEGLQKHGYVRNLESRFLMKDGSYKTALMSATVIQLNDEPHILSITRDITNFRNAEHEKLMLERQLHQAQKMESVGRLAGGVAHDFNNMLGVIHGHAEMAMEQLDPTQPIFADLQQIQHAAVRSADITRQLLAFARKQIVTPKVIDLNETIDGMLKMLLRLIGEDIDLEWQPGEKLWPIKMDPSQVDQILVNLCVNARDAIAGVGRITVKTSNCTFDEKYCSRHADFNSGQYVEINMSDNGCGMDKETLSHIFEPFFTTKGVSKGTGLGLATIYGIVKQNKGFIHVCSEQKQGTTFSVYLPRLVAQLNRERVDLAEQTIKCGSETILLVEDEPTILNMATTMLQRLGYTVLTAGTPGEAVSRADTHPGEIHLLLTDLIMPEMNGRALMEKLVRNRPELKCLFMSGYTAKLISDQGILEDGVFFIPKPFTKKQLSNKIRKTLSGG